MGKETSCEDGEDPTKFSRTRLVGEGTKVRRTQRASLDELIAYLLTQLYSFEANFTSHPMTVTQLSKVKLVRYQQNPTPNWGPATKAESGMKRKRADKDE